MTNKRLNTAEMFKRNFALFHGESKTEFFKGHNVLKSRRTEALDGYDFGDGLTLFASADIYEEARLLSEICEQSLSNPEWQSKLNRILTLNGYRESEILTIYAYSGRELLPDNDVEYRFFDKENMNELYRMIDGGAGRKSIAHALAYTSEDVCAIAALIDENPIAVAGADDKSGDMWQIGIDTLSSYRGKGIAKYLVNALAEYTVKLGKTPYYSTWLTNIASRRTAVAGGFSPVCCRIHSKKA